ncbi:MAG: hypothetical protein KIT60_09590 [Burkholderiaceae bacterium]|nr:hypothetical protein [Burkholderiaceae bacterium]
MQTSIMRGVAAIALLAWATPLPAADEKAKGSKPAKPSAAQQRADKAKGRALAEETVQRVSEAQLEIADRVHTGDAACEFDQVVNLVRIDGKPGHFKLTYKKASYTVVPEETTSGALRLEDKKAGIVWLQIPSKSMLMNSKIGQRLADNCLHPEQRAAVRAVEGAAERKP